jgi:hypothetical protein
VLIGLGGNEMTAAFSVVSTACLETKVVELYRRWIPLLAEARLSIPSGEVKVKMKMKMNSQINRML